MARHTRGMMRGREDEETYMFVRHLPEMLTHFELLPRIRERKAKHVKSDVPAEPAQSSEP
jgi:hypothetical protein